MFKEYKIRTEQNKDGTYYVRYKALGPTNSERLWVFEPDSDYFYAHVDLSGQPIHIRKTIMAKFENVHIYSMGNILSDSCSEEEFLYPQDHYICIRWLKTDNEATFIQAEFDYLCRIASEQELEYDSYITMQQRFSMREFHDKLAADLAKIVASE